MSTKAGTCMVPFLHARCWQDTLFAPNTAPSNPWAPKGPYLQTQMKSQEGRTPLSYKVHCCDLRLGSLEAEPETRFPLYVVYQGSAPRETCKSAREAGEERGRGRPSSESRARSSLGLTHGGLWSVNTPQRCPLAVLSPLTGCGPAAAG